VGLATYDAGAGAALAIDWGGGEFVERRDLEGAEDEQFFTGITSSLRAPSRAGALPGPQAGSPPLPYSGFADRFVVR